MKGPNVDECDAPRAEEQRAQITDPIFDPHFLEANSRSIFPIAKVTVPKAPEQAAAECDLATN